MPVQTLSIVCKLRPDDASAAALAATLSAFAKGCRFVERNTPAGIANKFALQKLCYADLREHTGLPANLAIRALARVAGTRAARKTTKGGRAEHGRGTSAQYDARTFRFREADWTVSLSTVHGRVRVALDMADWQRFALHQAQPTSATLFARRSKGRTSFVLAIQVDRACSEPAVAADVLGIDLGRRDIAHTSSGRSWSGNQTTATREHYAATRRSIQRHSSAKGTRSSRRRCRQLLDRLSGKERRFQRDVNHQISAQLVRQAKAQGCALALEDLTGIRERVNEKTRSTAERRRSNSWAFYQLRQFIAYKAALAGVEVRLVEPPYTSQTCAECLCLGTRSAKAFACPHCGHRDDADRNGAHVIRILGLHVNQPRGPVCALPKGTRQGSHKPSPSDGGN